MELVAMEFVAMGALALLVKKFVDFMRYLSARDTNGVVTQLTTWVAGVGASLLVAQTGWAGEIIIGDAPLSSLNTWSLIFVGLTLASSASVVQDVTKAVDNNNTARIPTLIRPNSTDNIDG